MTGRKAELIAQAILDAGNAIARAVVWHARVQQGRCSPDERWDFEPSAQYVAVRELVDDEVRQEAVNART